MVMKLILQELVVKLVNLVNSQIQLVEADVNHAKQEKFHHILVRLLAKIVVVVEKQMQLELVVISVLLVNTLTKEEAARDAYLTLILIYLAHANVMYVAQVVK